MVSLDSVVAEALTVIGASGDDEVARLLARQWAWRACVDMPVTEDSIKVSRVYPKNLLLKKPSDMQKFLEIALYDVNGNFIPHEFHGGKTRIYPNIDSVRTTSTNTDGTTTTHYFPVDLSEDIHNFVLGTNATAVAYADVRYFSYPIDNSGMPLIREDDVLTCVYFIRFMWSLRKNDNRGEIQQNELLYKQEADRARAKRKAADLSQDKAKSIAATMNRMIPNFNRSRF
jgi:hypothetical protein